MKANRKNKSFLSEQNYPRSPCLKEKAKIPRIKILLGQGVLFQT